MILLTAWACCTFASSRLVQRSQFKMRLSCVFSVAMRRKSRDSIVAFFPHALCTSSEVGLAWANAQGVDPGCVSCMLLRFLWFCFFLWLLTGDKQIIGKHRNKSDRFSVLSWWLCQGTWKQNPFNALFAMRQQKLHGKGFSKIARSKSTDFSDSIAMACPNQQCWLSMTHALDNGDVDKAFVHLKKCSNMAAKFNKLRVVLISKRSQAGTRHNTEKKSYYNCYNNSKYLLRLGFWTVPRDASIHFRCSPSFK